MWGHGALTEPPEPPPPHAWLWGGPRSSPPSSPPSATPRPGEPRPGAGTGEGGSIGGRGAHAGGQAAAAAPPLTPRHWKSEGLHSQKGGRGPDHPTRAPPMMGGGPCHPLPPRAGMTGALPRPQPTTPPAQG